MFELIHLSKICPFSGSEQVNYLVAERKIEHYKLQNSIFLDVAQQIQHWPKFSDQLCLLPQTTGLYRPTTMGLLLR